ncbi:MAG TPA: hypothetical protein VGD67_18900, partial [Pseudonocardiaceae bacterium]
MDHRLTATPTARRSASPLGERRARLRLAEDLQARHATDPDGVLAEAGALISGAGRHTELRVVARHAVALAHNERSELRLALRHARLAL